MTKTFQEQALELGLTREQIADHAWGNGGVGDATLSYLRNRPEDVTVQQAMENVRGLDFQQIRDIVNFTKKGVDELRLTPTQLYMGRFGKDQFERIQSGEKYKTVMPDAFKRISELPSQKAYTQGATLGALGSAKPNTELGVNWGNLPVDLANIVASALDSTDGRSLANTTTKARDQAKSFQQQVIGGGSGCEGDKSRG